MDITQIITGLFGLAGILSGVFFTYRARNKENGKTNEQKLIDQLQEEQLAQGLRLKDLEAKIEKLSRRDSMFRQYVFKLLDYIRRWSKDEAPPVDAMPEELL